MTKWLSRGNTSHISADDDARQPEPTSHIYVYMALYYCVNLKYRFSIDLQSRLLSVDVQQPSGVVHKVLQEWEL
jgi:hypothetical protein